MIPPNLFLFSGMVYDDAEVLYAEVKKDGDKLLEDAFKVLFPHSVPIPASPAFAAPSTWQPAMSFTRDTQKVLAAEGELVAYNTTFLPRRDVVRLPISHLGEPDTLRRRCVQMGKGGEGYALFEAGEGAGVAGVSGMFADCMPASGQYEGVCGKTEKILIKGLLVYTNGADHFVLRNASVQLTISKGRITSLLDVQLEYGLLITLTGHQLTFTMRQSRAYSGWSNGWSCHLRRPTKLLGCLGFVFSI
jgi:alpha-mannosidase